MTNIPLNGRWSIVWGGCCACTWTAIAPTAPAKNALREWYADQPALQERLKLEPAELGHQDVYRPLDYLDATAQAAILNDCLVVLVMEFGLNQSLLYEDGSPSYFEGEKCALVDKGYSPDHRPDGSTELAEVRPQVNYDVEVLPDGFPARAGVYPGNVPDNRMTREVSGGCRVLDDRNWRQKKVPGRANPRVHRHTSVPGWPLKPAMSRARPVASIFGPAPGWKCESTRIVYPCKFS